MSATVTSDRRAVAGRSNAAGRTGRRRRTSGASRPENSRRPNRSRCRREVGALLRSLGDPPIHGGTAAGHYFNAVAQRSAAVAIALALSADLLADSAAD